MILECTYTGPCIYSIINLDSGLLYFGQTRKYNTRTKQHLSDLKGNRHANIWLQRSYLKNHSLLITPVEKCLEETLNDREKFWINYHKTNNRNNGYNLSEGGDFSYNTLSEEAKKRRADSRKGKSGSLKGRKQTKEHIRNRSIATKGISKPMSFSTLTALKKERKKNIRTYSGKAVQITDLITKEILNFDTIRRASVFLQIDERSLNMKFYKGRSMKKVLSIEYKHYKIKRNV